MVVDPTTLPNGNQDVGLHLGVTVGNVWLVTPELDTWLIVDLHGSRGWFYPDLSDTWGSLFSNTVWHLGNGRDAYVLAGSSVFWGNGNYTAGELGLAQPLWSGATARAELGAGLYMAGGTTTGFWMPSGGAGIDQALPTGTTLGLRYAFGEQFLETGSVAPRHQLYGRLSQRVSGNWEFHVSYLETLDVSTGAGFAEGYLGAGVAYDL